MVGPASQGEERLLAPMLSVASSPHVRTPETIPRIMWTVNATLLPVAIWAVYVFGWRALAHIAVCVGSAVAAKVPLSAAVVITPRLSRSHWTAAPATKIVPSSA